MTKFKTSTPTPNKASSRVLAIDPGFGRIGVAIVTKENEKNKEKLLFSACIVTDPKAEHHIRLLQIGKEIKKIIKDWKPDCLAMEKLFFNQNISTGIRVAEARGVILYEAAEALLPVCEYSPQEIKIAVTGYGKATKLQVQTMSMKILSILKKPKLDDEADAMALGITHIATQRYPQMESKPVAKEKGFLYK